VERDRSAKLLDYAALRYRMRDAAQSLTGASGVRQCGKARAFQLELWAPAAELRVSPDGRPFFAGLARCSSVWECPVCAPRIQAGRAEELRKLGAAHKAHGGAMYHLTLTLPHDVGDRLQPMRRAVSQAWQRVTAGAPWLRWKDRLQLAGSVRALEVTHGVNGWHAHIHCALYTEAPLGEATIEELRAWILARWTRQITRAGYRAPSAEHGVRLSAVEDPATFDYLAKMGLASELASSHTKDARPGHRTPFQVLRDLTLGEDPDARRRDLRIWREWARGIKGARQLTYSRSLTQLALGRYAVAIAAEDSELPDTQAELEGLGSNDSELVYAFTREEWRAVTGSRSSVALRLRLLAIPLRFPRWEWTDQIVRVLDAARGLAPVPF
jgi:hypothetical protein